MMGSHRRSVSQKTYLLCRLRSPDRNRSHRRFAENGFEVSYDGFASSFCFTENLPPL